MKKGIGPRALGSPLKQTKTKKTVKKGSSEARALDARSYLKGEQGYIPDALTGGKPTRQAMNESRTFNPRTSEEFSKDMSDSKMLGTLREAQNNRDDKGFPTSAGQKRNLDYYIGQSKKTRPNRKDRY